MIKNLTFLPSSPFLIFCSKRLLKKVQCRLKLLKNKRVTIVRQLKDDLSELLKHGHEQIAFDRVYIYHIFHVFCSETCLM